MNWHSLTTDEVFQAQKSRASGLLDAEIAERKALFGPNIVLATKDPSPWKILLGQLKSPIIYLLVVASGVSFLFGDITEGVAIISVIIITASIGFVMEIQALKSMQALKKLDRIVSKVIRNNQLKEISSEALVPGDIMVFEAGDIIAADGRLIEATQLETDESMLSGESVPVQKTSNVIAKPVHLTDRNNMIWKGTSVTRGNGKAIITSTGEKTEIGKISGMVRSVEKDEIPLNKKLEKFSHRLIWLVLIIAMPMVFLGILGNRDFILMIETGIALAVAAIPEGLPIVATVALAKGMLQLAKRNVIVKNLSAVETLGETNVILTDKTGTITENKLKVDSICLCEGPFILSWNKKKDLIFLKNEEENTSPDLTSLLTVASLCNNANLTSSAHIGDPLEIALLEFAKEHKKGHAKNSLSNAERISEVPFDSETKIMATLHKIGDRYTISAKGAAESLMDCCSFVADGTNIIAFSSLLKEKWITKNSALAGLGLKVLAFASKDMIQPGQLKLENLVFLGLIGFLDPARVDVPNAIRICKEAGIKVVMVTGDHAETARVISEHIGLFTPGEDLIIKGEELRFESEPDKVKPNGILSATIYSRVTPVQKLNLVKMFQKSGQIVAMTGDGINDAPALKNADIGIAMGIRGTQVAQQAADMVLKDDSFSSIVLAIKYGRIIYGNIKKFIIYLMSCNLSEIMVVSVAAFINSALPLLPLQILFLNLVTDVFPALALGMGKGNDSVMHKPPKNPHESLLTRRNWISIAAYAMALTVAVLGAFLYASYVLRYDDQTCNNIAFFSLAFAQLIHPINLISTNESIYRNDIVRNIHLWAAVVLCFFIVGAVYFMPYTQEVLNLGRLNGTSIILIAIASILPVIIIQPLKWLGCID